VTFPFRWQHCFWDAGQTVLGKIERRKSAVVQHARSDGQLSGVVADPMRARLAIAKVAMDDLDHILVNEVLIACNCVGGVRI
jgi:hypothetical protein